MPAHIFIHGRKYTNTGSIVQWIAHRTGWPVMTDSDLVQQAGERFGMGAASIERALCRGDRPTKRAVRRRKKAVAYLTRTLSETLRTEAGILSGVAGHLIPSKMPHVLRVLVTDDTGDRIQRATRERHIPEKEARSQIGRTDRQAFAWHRYFTGSADPREDVYDVVIPTGLLDTEAAAHLIVEHLAEKAKAAPDDIETALDDFALGAEIQLAMAEKGYDITAAATSGQVTLTIDRRVLRLKKMTEKLERMVAAMPNVSAVNVTAGRQFHQADIIRRTSFEMAPAMAFEGYEKRRRQLRQSAIGGLAEQVRPRPEPTVGIDRRLTLQ